MFGWHPSASFPFLVPIVKAKLEEKSQSETTPSFSIGVKPEKNVPVSKAKRRRRRKSKFKREFERQLQEIEKNMTKLEVNAKDAKPEIKAGSREAFIGEVKSKRASKFQACRGKLFDHKQSGTPIEEIATSNYKRQKSLP